MNLDEIRYEIDEIDAQIVELYKRRMRAVSSVLEYKRQNNLPVLDKSRERKLLNRLSELAGKEFSDDIVRLYSLIMEQSRAYQKRNLTQRTKLIDNIENAIDNTPQFFPKKATVAVQGTEGAYSQSACDKLFALPDIMYFKSFESVFSAIESGMCKYGILPIENNTAGSVNKVYDLMMSHNFSIVRSIRIKVDHVLLTKKGASLSEIHEIVSHEQAINQCSKFLSEHKDIKVTVFENTAKAAEYVAKSERHDLAAIASENCCDIYSLSPLAKNIQNSDNNFTRFICISKNLEIYPAATKTSMMMTLPHKPGSLYNILSKFYLYDVNITKLESRPLVGKGFEFMFYFDIEAPINAENTKQLLNELYCELDYFLYLGSYTEII